MKLLILCFYINVDGLTPAQAEEILTQLMQRYKLDIPGYHIEQIWLPIKEGDSRVECIYSDKNNLV
jgi:hypothetical protein